ENAQSGQSAGGTTGSRRESEYVPGNPVWQPSVGEKSVVVPNPSCSAAGGCEVDPDAAPAVLPAV
ncbi:hypothetical protein A2U01_0115031, partial [Trifolium medium]|nr:hypothetical protein [Trifolium medium]